MKTTLAAGALALAMTLGACQTLDTASRKLGEQCTLLRIAALGVQVGAPAKVREKAADAITVINAVCVTPPTDSLTAIAAVERALQALQEARA